MDNITIERKYYIMTHTAEEVGYKLLYLTEAEAEFLRKIFDEEIISGGGYCGSCSLSCDSWYSKDSAMDAILEGGFE